MSEVSSGKKFMSIVQRIQRHAKLSLMAAQYAPRQTPPILIIFINSICNLACEHCFYWRNLNQRDDLTFEEFKKLSDELGEFEILNLSGGEPFIRPEFGEICSLFIQKNRVKEIYVPTNGYFTEKTQTQIERTLENQSLKHFVAEISLDGMPEFHNKFRGNPKSFEKAMETYDVLAEMQKKDARLRIHANSVATSDNMDEIWQLTEYLFNRCPSMDHHNLAVIRGDRKNPSLAGPVLRQYSDLYRRVSEVWKVRELGRFGAVVEPMMQWAKIKTMEENRQFVSCTAGIMTGVIYANGDVSLCETHSPLANLREKGGFFAIWDSQEANDLRRKIKAKQCFCTQEIALWPSIVFQPVELGRAFVNSKVVAKV